MEGDFLLEPIDTEDQDIIIPEVVSFNLEDNENTDPQEVTEKNLISIYERTMPVRTELSLKAQRLFNIVMGLIRPDGNDINKFTFNVSDYTRLFGIEEYYPKKQLKLAADELLKTRTFYDPKNPENYLKTGLISSFEVQDGVAKFEIASKLLTFYKLTKEQDQYFLGNTKNFKNNYSFPFYELFLVKLASVKEDCNGEENAVRFDMTIQEIRNWLNIKGYIDKKTNGFNYNGFKTKVLNKIEEDINRKNEEGQCLSNVNFSYIEKKVGRKVVKLEFTVWRVKSYAIEPELDAFYKQQPADIRLGYDYLISIGIEKKIVEECILTYTEKFTDIVRYVNQRKNRGKAYISSILINGWVDNTSYSTDTIKNISKVYSISGDEENYYNELADFINAQTSSYKKVIYKAVADFLKDSPQLAKFIRDYTVEEIMESKDLRLLFLYNLSDIVLNKVNGEIAERFDKFRSSGEVEFTFEGREEIVERLKEYGIVNSERIKHILEDYEDQYIQANMDYCYQKYVVAKGQKKEETSGAVIASLEKDYAGFRLAQREQQLEQEKQQQLKLEAEAIARMSHLELEQYKETHPDMAYLVDEEISKRNQKTNETANMMFEFYLANSSHEEREIIKRDVLVALPKLVEEQLKQVHHTNDLKQVDVDELLKHSGFRVTYKRVYFKSLKNM